MHENINKSVKLVPKNTCCIMFYSDVVCNSHVHVQLHLFIYVKSKWINGQMNIYATQQCDNLRYKTFRDIFLYFRIMTRNFGIRNFNNVCVKFGENSMIAIFVWLNEYKQLIPVIGCF